jgi:CRP-like cAMP-binding protein
MYVVLEGLVLLQQRDDILARANPGDYFYEEHLELSDLPVSLKALATAGT